MAYSQEWLEDPTAIRGILVELIVYNVLSGLDETLYLSNIGYMTGDSSISYAPIIVNGMSFSESIDVNGGSTLSVGDISVANYNGEYDTWLDPTKYVWMNRGITIYLGDPRWVCNTLTDVHNSFEMVFNGIIWDIDSKSRDTLDFKIRDKMERLNSPVTENTLGTYGTWEGGQQNQDMIKPLVFGEVFNISPPLIDPSTLEYMLIDDSKTAERIIEIRDEGVPIYSDSVQYSTLTTVTNTYASTNQVINVTKTTVVTNAITCNNTDGLIPGLSIVFSGTTFGNIVAATTYYVKEIYGPFEFSISAAPELTTVFVLASGTGTCSASAAQANVIECLSTKNMLATKKVFVASNIGGLVANTIYYIKTVYSTTKFTVSSTVGGAAVTLSTVSGASVVLTIPNVIISTSKNTFKLNNKPSGLITASVQGVKHSISFPSAVATPTLGATYNNNIASLVALIATQYGKSDTRLALTEIDPSNFYNYSSTYSVGTYVSSKENLIEVCSRIAGSAGSVLHMSRKGLLQLLTIGIPTSDAEVTVTSSDMLHHTLEVSSKIDIESAKKLGYSKNWTVQEGLLTAIPEVHKNSYATEWYSTTKLDAGIRAIYKLKTLPEQVDTMLIDKAEAEAEATRLLDYFKIPRTVYKFSGTSRLLSLKLGQAVRIIHSRFNLYNGGTGTVGQVISLTPKWLSSTIDVEVLI